MPGWKEATAVEQLSSNTYSCELQPDWCIGSVPNGGYVTGCVLEVVKKHFSTSLAKQNQPHTITLHIEFLRRTQAGPAVFSVQDVKLGRQATIVHVTMEQDGRKEIVAYVTNSNMDEEDGVSFDTEFEMTPPPPAIDFVKAEKDQDPNWARKDNMPHGNFRKATKQVVFYLPRVKTSPANIEDEWLCFSNGENFTDSSIGFVADMFPQIVEKLKADNSRPFWYPTLLLNLDIKKSLPPGGVKWLQIRVGIKKIKFGRMDIEVLIHDAEGELIAQSHHVGLVLDAERNTAARSNASVAKI